VVYTTNLGGELLLESLLEIKEAEDSADRIVEKAKSDMKRILEDADLRRDDIVSSTRSKTIEEIKKIKEFSIKEANEEAQKIVHDGENDLESLRKASKVNFSRGVETAISSVIR